MPRLVLALALALAAALPADASPLFTRARDTAALERTAISGIGRVQPLRLDVQALADLRGRDAATVDGFPLGRDRTAMLEVTRFSPFPPTARVEVMEATGARALALPDATYFRGRVAGEPESRVLLIAGPDEVHGFIVSGSDVFPFGRSVRGTHLAYALRDVNPAFFPPPGDFCQNDLHPEAVSLPAPTAPPVAADPAIAGLPLKQAEIAIETDEELRAKFATDQETLDYLASLLAATTAIYENDVSANLVFSYIRLWNTTDPWTAADTSGSLSELRTYWNANMTGTPRDLVHMVSGKPVQGGIAYVNVLCNASFGYGVSQVFGSFDLAMPSQIWDVEVFAHELGHEFGSPHTHCYSPPVDMCYNMEAGCYSGAVVPSQGTIMSYCHLNAGGLANISLVFGGTVSARIGTSIAAASCLSTVTTTSTSLTTTSTSVPSTTSTSVTTTTSTSITTTTSTSVTTTTSSSTTSTSLTTTTSTSVTSTTSTSSTSTSLSTTSTTSSSTTSTTAPDVGGADGDEDDDGVPDVIDHCAGTPAGDLHDASGCSECPCAGPAGSGWASRGAYQRCVRDAVKRRLVARVFSANDRRAAMQHAKQSSCGRPGRTRCCVDPGACRIVTPAICDARGGSDVGAGSCRPSPCE